ncbi:hypothetical protein DFS33DRAFT_1063176 [Desarmillaria ectypa]|nr:hypothetical protein DFS33DRAFT_1063176 [Desarmillaria ectypa]
MLASMYKIADETIIPFVLVIIASTCSFAPAFQSFQQTLKAVAFRPCANSFAPTSAFPPPTPSESSTFASGHTRTHLITPSIWNPILFAALILGTFDALAVHTTHLKPKPLSPGRSRA